MLKRSQVATLVRQHSIEHLFERTSGIEPHRGRAAEVIAQKSGVQRRSR